VKRYRVMVDGQVYTVEVDDVRAGRVTARLDGVTYEVEVERAKGATPSESPVPLQPTRINPRLDAARVPSTAPSGQQLLTAPIPGKIANVVAVVGQVVARGDTLLTIEAMNMFNVIRSPWAGKIVAVHVNDGAQVVQGERLISVHLG
jgi:glutaconyl-CoA/methylmalonyl-CoA decarboxylase subunit gamma